MSFQIYKVVNNGNATGFSLNNLDPSLNYRFKIVASNSDGSSPDSNIVEWGSIRAQGVTGIWTGPRVYNPVLRSLADFPSSMPKGFWVGKFESGGINIYYYDHYWDGTGDPIEVVEFPFAILSGESVEENPLTFYSIQEPNGVESGMFIKYMHSTRMYIYALYKDGFEQWSFREITIEDLGGTTSMTGAPEDCLIMEDGLMILKGTDISEGVFKWVTRQPDDIVRNFSDVTYSNSTDAICSLVEPIPHQCNSYPLSLDCGVADWLLPEQFDYVNYIKADHYDSEGNIVISALVSALPVIDGWTASETSELRGVVTPLENVYWLGFNLTQDETLDVLLVAYDKDNQVVTNITNWGGAFVIDESLYVFGRSLISGDPNTDVFSAPGTVVQTDYQVVNIHKMINTMDTGLGGDCSDVGPNLWTVQSWDYIPYEYDHSPIIKIGNPENYAGTPYVLASGDLVIPRSLYLYG